MKLLDRTLRYAQTRLIPALICSLYAGFMVFTLPAYGYQGSEDHISASEPTVYSFETVKTYQVPEGCFNDIREYVFAYLDNDSVYLLNRSTSELVIVGSDTTLVSRIHTEATHGDNLSIIDAAKHSSGRLIIADYIGGTVNILNINDCTITERIQSPLSSISSIVSTSDSEIIVTGTFRNRRIHSIRQSGRVRRSVNQDINYTNNRPPFAVGGDRIIHSFGNIYYYHPAKFEVTVYNTDIRQGKTYRFQGIQEYVSPYTFDRDQYPNQREAKIAFPTHFTPLKGIYPVRDDVVLTSLKLISGQYRYDLWSLDETPRHIRSVDVSADRIIGVYEGTLVTIKDRVGESIISLLRLSDY